LKLYTGQNFVAFDKGTVLLYIAILIRTFELVILCRTYPKVDFEVCKFQEPYLLLRAILLNDIFYLFIYLYIYLFIIG